MLEFLYQLSYRLLIYQAQPLSETLHLMIPCVRDVLRCIETDRFIPQHKQAASVTDPIEHRDGSLDTVI